MALHLEWLTEFCQNCTKLTQAVLIQSLEDEFQIDSGGHIPQTPAAPGQILGPVAEETESYGWKSPGCLYQQLMTSHLNL